MTNAAPVLAPEMMALSGQYLPVKQFMTQCDLLIANNCGNCNEDTAKDVRTIVRIFCGVQGEHNVPTSSALDQTHLAVLRQHFNNILARWGGSSRYVLRLKWSGLSVIFSGGFSRFEKENLP
ncbi:hypothetical protein [Brucella anthropi]|uniref:hypothetical protein n=1 Tax=Brucella anthropi TaxID=529 RepID=UPI001CFE0BBD|nr:hypothetical protein [Brucella anthropi]